MQARIRPRPRLCDASHRRPPTRKPASRDTESHGNLLDQKPAALISNSSGAFRKLPWQQIGLESKSISTLFNPFREFPCPAGTAGFRVRRRRGGPEGAGARRRWRTGNLFTGPQAGRAKGRRRRPLAQPASVVARSATHFSASLRLSLSALRTTPHLLHALHVLHG